MRIVGGQFRGRRLASVGKGDAGAHLRPTSDRVRESLFNILDSGYRDQLQSARVLDGFAGTGALGLEALSRGAAHVTFVEQSRAALAILRQNIDLCRAGGATDIQIRDVRKLKAPKMPYDLVFLDPPYGKTLGEPALQNLLRTDALTPGALIVWEENTTVTAPAPFLLQDERRYGDTVIRLFEHQS